VTDPGGRDSQVGLFERVNDELKQAMNYGLAKVRELFADW